MPNLIKICFTVVILSLTIACSDNDEKSLKSKLTSGNWTGWYLEGNYRQVFSMQFRGDGTCTWYELHETHDGTWSLSDDDALSISLTNTNHIISGTLQGDSLSNVVSNANLEIHSFRESGKLPSMEALDGSTWNGTINVPAYSIYVEFRGEKIDLSSELKYHLLEDEFYVQHGTGLHFKENQEGKPHAYVIFQNGKMIGSGYSFMLDDFFFTAEQSD